eukprot:5532753-Pleurochrysis_carterae.AAC.1
MEMARTEGRRGARAPNKELDARATPANRSHLGTTRSDGATGARAAGAAREQPCGRGAARGRRPTAAAKRSCVGRRGKAEQRRQRDDPARRQRSGTGGGG